MLGTRCLPSGFVVVGMMLASVVPQTRAEGGDGLREATPVPPTGSLAFSPVTRLPRRGIDAPPVIAGDHVLQPLASLTLTYAPLLARDSGAPLLLLDRPDVAQDTSPPDIGLARLELIETSHAPEGLHADFSLAYIAPEPNSPFRFHVGRTTALRDGGIEGARPALDPTATNEYDDHLRSYAQAGGEFDLYDLSVEWEALRPGPLTLSVIGGVRAIRAEVNQTRESTGPGGESLTTFDDGRGLVTVPVVGGGVSWLLADGLHVRTTASTQSLPSGASYLDLVAETGIRLAPNISLTAGYQFVETRLEVDNIEAELDQEGLFARLQIKF